MGKRIFEILDYLWEVFLNTIFPKDYKCLVCEEETEEGICNRCKGDISLVKDITIKDDYKIYSYAYYKGTIKSLILEFKYHNDYNCGEFLAEALIERFKDLINTSDIITYVPLTTKKKKIRGFNQCEFICKYISRNSNIIVKDLLYKIKDNKEQKTLDMKSRISNQIGLYKFKNTFDLKGKKILLIDDVFTTGATINECVKVLMNNGAKEINALTISKSTI